MRGILFTLVVLTANAAVVDRIAATVGKQVIFESDVLRALRAGAFLDQKETDLSGESKRRAAERLVDQILIQREAAENRVVLPGDDDASKLMDAARLMFSNPQDYRSALAKYQLSEAELREHLLAGYRMLRFTDLRFRPEVQVAEAELRDFYQLLAAGWRRDQAGQVPTFEESREQVQRMLTDQKAVQALDTWLSSARTQLGVSYRERVFE